MVLARPTVSPSSHRYLEKNKVAVSKNTIASLKSAAIQHVASGGALNLNAMQGVVGTTFKGTAKKIAVKSLKNGLQAMDLSIEICLRKKIAGKDIYFKGRVSGDLKTKKLSGSLTLLSRIDVGYLHLAQATITLKDIHPKNIKKINVQIQGEFCCGFVSDCKKAQYKGFGTKQSQNSDVTAAVSDARDKTFTGKITITHKADGTNSIAVNTGPDGLTLGKLFYVNVGAAVDAARAEKIVDFLGKFSEIGVKNMGLEWIKTKTKITKRLKATPSFGDVSKYTCDIGSDQFTASKCALKSLAAATGDATIEVVSLRDVVPKVDDDNDATATDVAKNAALIVDAEAKSTITMTIRRESAVITVVFKSNTVSITIDMGKEKIDLSFVHIRHGIINVGITKKEIENNNNKPTEFVELGSGGWTKKLNLNSLLESSETFGRSSSRRRSSVKKSMKANTGQIKSRHGICLDASQRNSNGGKVHMWSCDTNNANQQWNYDASTGQIKSRHGICLDASQRNSNGGKVHMWSCDTSNANQQWNYDASTGQIKSRHGICLDASGRNSNGGKVHMWSCDTGNANQQWNVATSKTRCQDINIGNGDNKRKKFAVRAGYICPARVDKNNWLSSDTYGDWFSTTRETDSVSVIRSDGGNGGWGWVSFCFFLFHSFPLYPSMSLTTSIHFLFFFFLFFFRE